MSQLAFTHVDAVDALSAQIADFVSAARSCKDLELLGPSRCHGWSRVDVVVHVRAGLDEMARGTTARALTSADHDAATYWRGHLGADLVDPVDGILWLRRVASAYARPVRAVRHLEDVAEQSVRAIRAMPECVVDFQGCQLRSGDFLATWAVELAVHQLDLDLTDPPPSGLAWARLTLEALAGTPLPSELDDTEAVLAGLGRIPSRVSLDASYPVTL